MPALGVFVLVPNERSATTTAARLVFVRLISFRAPIQLAYPGQRRHECPGPRSSATASISVPAAQGESLPEPLTLACALIGVYQQWCVQTIAPRTRSRPDDISDMNEASRHSPIEYSPSEEDEYSDSEDGFSDDDEDEYIVHGECCSIGYFS